MRRIRDSFSHALLASLCLAAAAGCTEQNGSLVILQNQPFGEENCEVSGTRSDVYVPFGMLDLDAQLPYLIRPLLMNGAVAVEGQLALHYAFLKGADIQLLPGPQQTSIDLINSLKTEAVRTQRFSGSVSPNGGTAATIFPAIDADQAVVLATRVPVGSFVSVVARITVFADMDGGEIATEPFDFPITLCQDCRSAPLDDQGKPKNICSYLAYQN
ncbi:MAG: hypothetical protein HY698_08800 [Deltaproteobacteria bacterium]|nr:hypothetical protein [Deltaproteobacteria bacterium]